MSLFEKNKEIFTLVDEAVHKLLQGNVTEIVIDTDGERVYIKTVKKTVRKKAV
jgi:hypothetical protein